MPSWSPFSRILPGPAADMSWRLHQGWLKAGHFPIQAVRRRPGECAQPSMIFRLLAAKL